MAPKPTFVEKCKRRQRAVSGLNVLVVKFDYLPACGRNIEFTRECYMSDEEKKKKPFYKKWWFILIAIVAVVGVINSGGEGGGSSAPVATTYGLGDVVKLKRFNVRITNATLSRTKLSTYGDPPAEGSVYVVLDGEWENVDSESRTPGKGQIFAELDGQEFKFDKSVSNCADGWVCFGSSTINPLGVLKGKIAFEVSERFDVTALQYAPADSPFSGQKKLRIDLDPK